MVRLPIDDVRPDPNNARVHTDEQIEVLAGSYRRFGQISPLVIDADNVIAKGSGFWAGMKRAGAVEVLCMRTALTGAELTAYKVADNRASDMSTFEWPVVAVAMDEIEAAGFSVDDLGWPLDQMEPIRLGEDPEVWLREEPKQSKPADTRDRLGKTRPILLTENQRDIFDLACEQIRSAFAHNFPEHRISDGRCVEFLAANYLSEVGVVESPADDVDDDENPFL